MCAASIASSPLSTAPHFAEVAEYAWAVARMASIGCSLS